MKVTRRSDLFLAVGSVAVFIAVAIFASLGKALASGVMFAVFTAIIQTKWESRHDRRFWTLISVFALIHILALIILRFPEPQYGLVSLPFAWSMDS